MEERDTIPEGSRIVVWHPLPQKVKVRGRTIIVYDVELMMMMIKQWRESGMSREEVEDLLLA